MVFGRSPSLEPLEDLRVRGATKGVVQTGPQRRGADQVEDVESPHKNDGRDRRRAVSTRERQGPTRAG